jgi:hypothetical protein
MVPARKLILGVILAGSTLLFFLILFATALAILHEAAPTGHGRATSLLAIIKRVVAHYIFHLANHR